MSNTDKRIQPPPHAHARDDDTSLQVRSSAFDDNAPIPEHFTAYGDSISPPLSWSGAPAGTKSFALAMEDLDSPYFHWVHWIAWNMAVTELDENAGEAGGRAEKEGILVLGDNSGRHRGYQGPKPPRGGPPHRYQITIYALDLADLKLPRSGVNVHHMHCAMSGHILASGSMIGLYPPPSS